MWSRDISRRGSPPLLPVAQELAGIRAAETEALDNEVDRLAYADLLGAHYHLARELAERELAIADESYQTRSRPRTRQEIQSVVEAQRKNRSRTGTETEGTES